MLEVYLIGLTIMGGCVTFYLSLEVEKYRIVGEYEERIYNWSTYSKETTGNVKFKAYRYDQKIIGLAILATVLWPISIIPCAGALVGSRMRTRA